MLHFARSHTLPCALLLLLVTLALQATPRVGYNGERRNLQGKVRQNYAPPLPVGTILSRPIQKLLAFSGASFQERVYRLAASASFPLFIPKGNCVKWSSNYVSSGSWAVSSWHLRKHAKCHSLTWQPPLHFFSPFPGLEKDKSHGVEVWRGEEQWVAPPLGRSGRQRWVPSAHLLLPKMTTLSVPWMGRNCLALQALLSGLPEIADQ